MLNRLQPDQVCHDLPISKHGQFQIVPLREISQLLGSRNRSPLTIQEMEQHRGTCKEHQPKEHLSKSLLQA